MSEQHAAPPPNKPSRDQIMFHLDRLIHRGEDDRSGPGYDPDSLWLEEVRHHIHNLESGRTEKPAPEDQTCVTKRGLGGTERMSDPDPKSPHYPFFIALSGPSGAVLRRDRMNNVREWLTVDHVSIGRAPANIRRFGYNDLDLPGTVFTEHTAIRPVPGFFRGGPVPIGPGNTGVIVHAYKGGHAFEVEFDVAGVGATTVTMVATEMFPLDGYDWPVSAVESLPAEPPGPPDIPARREAVKPGEAEDPLSVPLFPPESEAQFRRMFVTQFLAAWCASHPATPPYPDIVRLGVGRARQAWEHSRTQKL